MEPYPSDGLVAPGRFRTMRLKTPTVDPLHINKGSYTIADEEMIKMANGSARMTSGSVYEFIVVASEDGSEMVIASPIERVLPSRVCDDDQAPLTYGQWDVDVVRYRQEGKEERGEEFVGVRAVMV